MSATPARRRPAERRTTNAERRRAVLACERRLTTAEREADAATLHALLAPEFVGIDLRGQRIDRRGFIAGFRRPELRIDTLQIDRLALRPIGSAVVVVGRSRFTGSVADQPISGQAQFTNVWVLRADRWRLIASTVTRMDV